MKEAIQFLTGLFYPEWCPPNVPGRRHSLLDDSKSPRHEPVQARTKIMAVLGRYEWKTIDQIATTTAAGQVWVRAAEMEPIGITEGDRMDRPLHNG
jgi:hypothetical protein